jgi:hypothetical protein
VPRWPFQFLPTKGTRMRFLACLLPALLALAGRPAAAAETIWIEAEHLDGVRGYCWPMGRPDMKKTEGCWGLSGPGWAAEWNQGGESGFLSVAAGADDDKAAARLLHGRRGPVRSARRRRADHRTEVRRRMIPIPCSPVPHEDWQIPIHKVIMSASCDTPGD